MGNTFGSAFRITTWGESHGPAVGVVIDGCPPQIKIGLDDIQAEMDRRKPGQSSITTTRGEADRVQVLSGIFDDQTLGTPIQLLITNTDVRSEDYEQIKNVFRPSHADYTYQAKYGMRDWRGGGRASARETVGRVAAGAVARAVLRHLCNVQIIAYVKQVGTIIAEIDPETVAQADIESSVVRCPDKKASLQMIERINEIKAAGDSLGGVVEALARGVPPGLGEPVFDKLEADLGKAMLSIPACKGFEIGSGFGGVSLTGSEHNDLFYYDGERVRTTTNRSGGVQGGISNGETIIIRAAFKPTATIRKPQTSVDAQGKTVVIEGKGRHDPCVLPRAVPVVEAMMALVLADHALRQRGQTGQL